MTKDEILENIMLNLPGCPEEGELVVNVPDGEKIGHLNSLKADGFDVEKVPEGVRLKKKGVRVEWSAKVKKRETRGPRPARG